MADDHFHLTYRTRFRDRARARKTVGNIMDASCPMVHAQSCLHERLRKLNRKMYSPLGGDSNFVRLNNGHQVVLSHSLRTGANHD